MSSLLFCCCFFLFLCSTIRTSIVAVTHTFKCISNTHLSSFISHVFMCAAMFLCFLLVHLLNWRKFLLHIAWIAVHLRTQCSVHGLWAWLRMLETKMYAKHTFMSANVLWTHYVNILLLNATSVEFLFSSFAFFTREQIFRYIVSCFCSFDGVLY